MKKVRTPTSPAFDLSGCVFEQQEPGSRIADRNVTEHVFSA